MKKFVLFLSVLAIGAITFTGCKKKDGGGDDLDQYNKIKSAKFTVTTTGLQTTDRFTFLFSGSDAQGQTSTIFKVNGEPQTNQRNVVLTYAQLKAGVTVESAIPLANIVMDISGFADPAVPHTFTFRVKPVINNETKTDITATIGSSPAYGQQFSY